MYSYLNSSYIADAVTMAVRMIGGDEIAAIHRLYHDRGFIGFCEGFGNDVLIESVVDEDSAVDRILDILGGRRCEVFIDECTDDTFYKMLLLEYYRRCEGMGCEEVSDLFIQYDVFGKVDDFIADVYGGESVDNAITCIYECIERDRARDPIPVPLA